MKYERLTETKKINEYCSAVECGEHCEDCYVGNLYERLAELEDKIENGTLIELPCKVGTTVYYIVGVTTRKILKQKSDYYITKTQFFIDMLENYQNNWFLTKAEAENKLKELKGEV